MELIDWKSRLECCTYDAAVGIKIARLTGGSQFSTYLTSIDPGKSVNPHYHKIGDEHHHIIRGRGEIMLMDVESKKTTITRVNEYHSFVVHANTLHQLVNTGNEPLVLMFSCPENHLKSDRFVLERP